MKYVSIVFTYFIIKKVKKIKTTKMSWEIVREGHWRDALHERKYAIPSIDHFEKSYIRADKNFYLNLIDGIQKKKFSIYEFNRILSSRKINYYYIFKSSDSRHLFVMYKHLFVIIMELDNITQQHVELMLDDMYRQKKRTLSICLLFQIFEKFPNIKIKNIDNIDNRLDLGLPSIYYPNGVSQSPFILAIIKNYPKYENIEKFMYILSLCIKYCKEESKLYYSGIEDNKCVYKSYASKIIELLRVENILSQIDNENNILILQLLKHINFDINDNDISRENIMYGCNEIFDKIIQIDIQIDLVQKYLTHDDSCPVNYIINIFRILYKEISIPHELVRLIFEYI